MKKFFLLSFILFFIVGTISFAQNNLGVVGKIISETQAKKLFGNSQKSFHISGKQLSTYALSTHEYLLIGVKDNGNSLVVLDDTRKAIHPAGYLPADDEVFFVFSVTKVNELLGTGSKKISIELRENGVLTVLAKNAIVSDGEGDGEVLEYAFPCPPICPH